MSAINELIKQAEQEEIDHQQAIEIFASLKKGRIFEKCQGVARYIESALGPAWEELKPIMVKKYTEFGSVYYRLPDDAAEKVELTPFELWSNGEGVHIKNKRWGDRVIRGHYEFARFLMLYREGFREWNEKRQRELHLQELKKVYEYDLVAWQKEFDRILAANRAVIEAAQKEIPSFKVYDLEYVEIIGDFVRKEHAWVLDPDGDRDPDGEVFYLEIDGFGNVHKKKYFCPISIDIEAVIIEPGPTSGHCKRYDLPGGSIYYGPNVKIEDYLPLVHDLPEKPAIPQGLSEWDALQIEQNLLSHE